MITIRNKAYKKLNDFVRAVYLGASNELSEKDTVTLTLTQASNLHSAIYLFINQKNEATAEDWLSEFNNLESEIQDIAAVVTWLWKKGIRI